jgi:2-iminobutanoate/2-iminopropanoate deaminase
MTTPKTLEVIKSDAAPAAIGPYSQAIKARGAGLLFCSGQVPLDPATGKVVEGGIEAQTERVMLNLRAVLQEARLDWTDVAKTTIYLMDMGQFAKVNAIYAEHLGGHAPARATVQVAGLPLGVEVEIDAVAIL